MLNHCTIQGNLGQDPEIRFFESGSCLAEFSIACSKKIKGEDKTSWVNCKAWGKTAETISTYVKKGSQIIVEGELEQEKWQDRETGKNRSKLVLSVNRFHFVPKGESSPDDTPPPRQPVAASTQSTFDEIPF